MHVLNKYDWKRKHHGNSFPWFPLFVPNVLMNILPGGSDLCPHLGHFCVQMVPWSKVRMVPQMFPCYSVYFGLFVFFLSSCFFHFLLFLRFFPLFCFAQHRLAGALPSQPSEFLGVLSGKLVCFIGSKGSNSQVQMVPPCLVQMAPPNLQIAIIKIWGAIRAKHGGTIWTYELEPL